MRIYIKSKLVFFLKEIPNIYKWGIIEIWKYIISFFLSFFVVCRPTREFFTHMETSRCR